MSKEIFFNLKSIGHKDIAARSEEDLGLDWDIHSDTKTFGDEDYIGLFVGSPVTKWLNHRTIKMIQDGTR